MKLTKHKRFIIGIDRSKMRLYDVEESQQNLADELAGQSSPTEIYKSVGKDVDKDKFARAGIRFD